MARGPERVMACGCTTRAVGRPIICARTAVSSGTEARAPLKAHAARQMARTARPGNREIPFKYRISNFGFCTVILQAAGADGKVGRAASRRVMCVVYSRTQEKAMIFSQFVRGLRQLG